MISAVSECGMGTALYRHHDDCASEYCCRGHATRPVQHDKVMSKCHMRFTEIYCHRHANNNTIYTLHTTHYVGKIPRPFPLKINWEPHPLDLDWFWLGVMSFIDMLWKLHRDRLPFAENITVHMKKSWADIKFSFELGETFTQTYELMKKVNGDDCLSRRKFQTRSRWLEWRSAIIESKKKSRIKTMFICFLWTKAIIHQDLIPDGH